MEQRDTKVLLVREGGGSAGGTTGRRKGRGETPMGLSGLEILQKSRATEGWSLTNTGGLIVLSSLWGKYRRGSRGSKAVFKGVIKGLDPPRGGTVVQMWMKPRLTSGGEESAQGEKMEE